MTDAAKKRTWTKRIAFHILGMVVMAFGISMSIRAGIGVPPGGAIPYAVSRLSPLSIGQSSALFQIFCVLIQIAVMRRMTLNFALQMPMAYVFGLFVDFFFGLLDIGSPDMWFRVLFLVAALIIFSFGIRVLIGANVLLPPPDGLAQTMGNIFGWPMSKAKLVFDIVVVAIAALLTLVMAGNAFLVVGVGTVICAIGTGPIIGFFTKLFPVFDVGKKAAKKDA